ncbi:equilibrative nucleoside transporter 2 [Colossoma macropomum]|uniref:equilibrative nucleoside transporter 2 n=1 Tax=Colossoma macropomum TaxID=42526 RepID=UPI001864D0B0|nr:equilibrative nucleoside transporter 2 [Colossoma macropomum]XP_036444896.1 equilibrative nucleoside transporter 2 [Colossoma macropomum]
MKCLSESRALVAIILFILGMGTLLPWNFFTTAFAYFNDRLNTTMSNGTESGQTDPYMFNNMCVLISQLPLLLFTLLNSFLYQHIAEKIRIVGSMVFILLLFILTAALVKVKMEQDLFYNVTMTTIWFINMFGAVLQGSLFGLVGKLPQRYSSFFMSGQAVAGIFSAVAMLISQISEVDNENAALGYFVTPCAATLLTLCCYLLLPHLKFARDHLEDGPGNKEDTKKEGIQKESVTLVKVKLSEPAYGPNCSGQSNSKTADIREKQEEQYEEKSPVLAVLKKIWVMALCVTCVFMVTLSVFPAITVLVQPDALFTGIWADIFTALCCFLVFNVMDWIGRSVTSVVQWPSKESRLFPILVVARLIFIPAFMLCNIPSHRLSGVFKHEFAYILVMSLFAMTNGYFACLCMSYAPQLVRPKDAETTGALMTFFLALGLSLGAALSFVLKMLI